MKLYKAKLLDENNRQYYIAIKDDLNPKRGDKFLAVSKYPSRYPIIVELHERVNLNLYKPDNLFGVGAFKLPKDGNTIELPNPDIPLSEYINKLEEIVNKYKNLKVSSILCSQVYPDYISSTPVFVNTFNNEELKKGDLIITENEVYSVGNDSEDLSDALELDNFTFIVIKSEVIDRNRLFAKYIIELQDILGNEMYSLFNNKD